jgi:hypothetical protein
LAASPPESFMSSWIGRPFTPPAALIVSTSISAVRDSGRPRFAEGPVMAKIAPTLIGADAPPPLTAG